MLAQAAETASNWTDWGSLTALAAVLVSGLAVWGSRSDSGKRLDHEKELQQGRLDHEERESEKRLTHEERMLAQRLEHERIETVRTTAAKAYSSSLSVLVNITPDTVSTMGHYPFEEGEMNARALVGEAMDSLSVVGAMGWDGPVKTTASELREAVKTLADNAWALTKQIRQTVGMPPTDLSDLAAHDTLRAQVGAANDAVAAGVEAYRKAVAGEDAE